MSWIYFLINIHSGGWYISPFILRIVYLHLKFPPFCIDPDFKDNLKSPFRTPPHKTYSRFFYTKSCICAQKLNLWRSMLQSQVDMHLIWTRWQQNRYRSNFQGKNTSYRNNSSVLFQMDSLMDWRFHFSTSYTRGCAWGERSEQIGVTKWRKRIEGKYLVGISGA